MQKLTTRIKRTIITAMAMLGLVAPMGMPALAVAQPSIQGGLCEGASLEVTIDGQGKECTEGDGTDINDIITLVINIFSILVGLVAVIMIIVGGFKYITSQGDSGKVTSAKNTILFAIIGLVVVALAQIIVNFVLNRL